MKVSITEAGVTLYEQYEQARLAKSSWTAEERRLKAKLLEAVGYDQEDAKPAPVEVQCEGTPVFEVKVGNRKGLDIKYLRETHPGIYAECERWTYPISIRSAEPDPS